MNKPILDSIDIVRKIDDTPDLSYLETEVDNDGKIVSSCRYTNDDMVTYGKKKVLQWIENDRERLNNYGVTWHTVGIYATAEIKIPMGSYFSVQTIRSGGLWSIESDSKEDYLQSVEEGEKENLIEILKSLNVSNLDDHDQEK